jgi:transposase
LRTGKIIEVLERIIDQVRGEVLSIHEILTQERREEFKKIRAIQNPGGRCRER